MGARIYNRNEKRYYISEIYGILFLEEESRQAGRSPEDGIYSLTI